MKNILVLVDIKVAQHHHEGVRIDKEKVSFDLFHFQNVGLCGKKPNVSQSKAQTSARPRILAQKAGILKVGAVIVDEMLEGALERIDERLDVLVVVGPAAF